MGQVALHACLITGDVFGWVALGIIDRKGEFLVRCLYRRYVAVVVQKLILERTVSHIICRRFDHPILQGDVHLVRVHHLGENLCARGREFGARRWSCGRRIGRDGHKLK